MKMRKCELDELDEHLPRHICPAGIPTAAIELVPGILLVVGVGIVRILSYK